MKRDSVVNLLAEIRLRPAMFIGRSDIFCLKAFLDGWPLSDSDVISDLWIMGDFQVWIEKKYRSKTTHGWADLIAFYSGDTCRALNDFFEAFDVFLT